jgi:hypothetical protein
VRRFTNGRKINIILTKKSSCCFARFRLLLFGWGSICASKNPLMPRFIRKSGYCFHRWMGRSPQVIEDQVTYHPLVSTWESENQEYSCFFHVWNEFYLHHF